jgi:hypothetical protein
MAAYIAAEPSQESMTRRRRWKYRFLALLLSTGASFGLAELTLRIFDIQPPPPMPDHFADDARVDNTRNALGLREDWDTLPENDTRLRIAFLGDSMTYGYCV